MSENETFSDFKNSFSYGSRPDLNFKFLASLTTEEAAQFFQELLWKIGDIYDDDLTDELIALATTWQQYAYDRPGKRWHYEDAPFAPLARPLAESRLGLISSSGHFVAGDDPKPFGIENMSQEEAISRIAEFLRTEPTLSVIPMETPVDELRVRHGGYDIRGAQADPNVVLPLTRLQELQRAGVMKELATNAYSFVGATTQMRLRNKVGPQWVAMLKEQQLDAALLVPA